MSHISPPSANYSIFNSSMFLGKKGRPVPVIVQQPVISIPFSGDMEGRSITNVATVGRAIYTVEVNGQNYFSVKNHLDGTTLVQVKLVSGDEVMRVVCFVAAVSTDGVVSVNTLSDSSPSSSTNISLSASGVIAIVATNATALISTLCIG